MRELPLSLQGRSNVPFQKAFSSIIARNFNGKFDADEGSYNSQYDYDYDYDEYEYEGATLPPRRKHASSSISQRFNSILEMLRDHKQLGASLLGLGLLLTFAGMMLFFEATLLRLGNICIIIGIPLLLGPDTVKDFFIKKERSQATILIALGILLVFWGKPRLGIILEIFGALNLFG